MIDPVVHLLIWLSVTLGNLGWAILAFTLVVKGILYPINKTSLKSSIKMREVQPELQKLQKKYKKKPQELQKKQMELYKKAGVNPLGGCLPQIFQLVIIIILYRALLSLLKIDAVADGTIATHFFGLDLREPDPHYILPALAAASQFIASWLMMGKHSDRAQTNKLKSANSKQKDEDGLLSGSGQMIQKQMMYVMPLFTGFIAARFPAGISLYWVISTIFSVFQQWMVMHSSQRQKAMASVYFWKNK